MAKSTSLQDRFYPIRTFLSSRIKLPEAGSNTFVLKPQFNNTLPKYHGLASEDAYFFIREFEEVCLMMRIPQLEDDSIRLCSIHFAFKDLVEKWLHNLVVESIASWDHFVMAILKKFLPYL